MEGEEKYVGWVRSLSRNGLLHLWEQVKDGENLEPWPQGKAFEYLVLRAFELDGARVIWPYRSEWEQVDGVVYVDGLSCLIECKHWREPVDFGPIAKLKVRVDRRPPPVIGLLFSASGFTGPAVDEFHAQPLRNLLLWRESDVELALTYGMRNALSVKWRKAVEEAVMDHMLEREDFR